MKILVEYKDAEVGELKIKSARYLGNLIIEIIFSDESLKIVDFKPFISRSNHPTIKKYLDEGKFVHYKIIEGNLNWNDYEMIFPIEDLYEGKV